MRLPCLPPFYTARYVEVHNPVLSILWLMCGIAIVLHTLIHSLLSQHNYVDRETPNMDVTFWQDMATDSKWWPNFDVEPEYCLLNFTTTSNDGLSWGSDEIRCKRPSDTPGTYFYPSSNEMLVATSIAYGKDPQYNTSDVYVYEGMEEKTLGFQLSFITSRQHVPHVANCTVVGDEEHPDGNFVRSRYSALYPKSDYGEGYLVLSIGDIMRAVGRELDQRGSEGPLRATGLEVVAKFDLRNYHTPFEWPAGWWNPFGADLASEHECSVRFEVLRDQFTPIKWFYHGTEPIAVQHGLRLVAVGTGSIGYFSVVVLLEKLLLSFAAFGFAQVVLDLGWYYLFKEADTIAKRAYAPLEINTQFEGLPFRKPSSRNLLPQHIAKYE